MAMDSMIEISKINFEMPTLEAKTLHALLEIVINSSGPTIGGREFSHDEWNHLDKIYAKLGEGLKKWK